MRSLRRVNYPLVFGSAIVIIIIILIMLGDEIVQLDPYAMNFGTTTYEGGELIEVKPQIPPNRINFFGTDVLGRDIFSQIIYGAKTTFILVFLIVLLRFLIALPLAFLAGFNNKTSEKLIEFFSKAFSAIPVLLISIFILNFTLIKSLKLKESIIAFVIVLSCIGWGRLARVFMERIRGILKEDFIQGEIAIGKSSFKIAVENVLPHLIATIVIYLFMEISRVLLILAQLGVFSIYIGRNKINPKMIFDPPSKGGLGLDFMPPYEPEWGGLLGASKYAITSGKIWIVLFPALAFFISILGFNLLSEGLKREINKRNSRAIVTIKKIPFHISPRTFVYEVRNFRKNVKPVVTKSIVILLIITFALWPSPKSLYNLKSDTVFAHIDELSKDDYEGRRVGTQGRDKAAEYIAHQLKDYNVDPLFEDSYIEEVIGKTQLVEIKKSEVSILDSEGNIVDKLRYVENYSFNRILITRPYVDKEEEYDNTGLIITQEQLENGDYNRLNPHYVVLNDGLDPIRDIMYISSIASRRPVLGVILPTDNNEYLESKKLFLCESLGTYIHERQSEGFSPFIITVDKMTGKKLRNLENNYLELNNKIEIVKDLQFKNIGAIIKGKDDSSDEKIIIATNYDYLGDSEEKTYKGLFYNGSSIATSLGIAKVLGSIEEKPDMDIVFLFFDGSKFSSLSGADVYMTHNGYTFKNNFIFTINNLGLAEGNELFIDTSRASTKEQKYFGYIKYIEKRADELGIRLERESLIDGYEDIVSLCKYGSKGVLIESVDRNEKVQYEGRKQNNIELININKLSKQGQLILDTLIHIGYNRY